MLHIFILFVSIVLSFPNNIWSYDQFYREVANGGHSSNAGVRLTVTRKGVDYLSQAICYATEESSRNLPLDPIEITIMIVSQISFYDMRIDQYRHNGHCGVTMKSPNKMVLVVNNVDMTIKASINGGVLIFSTSFADWTAYLGGVSYEIGVSLERFRGYPRFRFLGCRANIGYVTQDLDGGVGMIRNALNSALGVVKREIQGHLESQLTKNYKKIIRAVNEEIKKLMPHKIALDEAKRRYNFHMDSYPKNGAIMNTIETGMKNLRIDNSLLRTPVVSGQNVVLDMKGEISWVGRGRTPFYPNSPTLGVYPGSSGRYRNTNNDKMIQVILSDYLINSMLYHAYRNGLLKLVIGPTKNWKLAKVLFMKQCDNLMCLGEHIPQIYDYYKQESLEMVLEFSKAPGMIIKNQKIAIYLDGHVTLLGQEINKGRGVWGPKTEIIKVHFDAQASVKILITRFDLLNATIDHVTTNVVKKSINRLNQQDIDDLVQFGSLIIENLLVEPFTRGFVIPKTKYGKLKNLHISLDDRKLILKSNLDLNFYEFANFAKKILRTN